MVREVFMLRVPPNGGTLALYQKLSLAAFRYLQSQALHYAYILTKNSPRGKFFVGVANYLRTKRISSPVWFLVRFPALNYASVLLG